MASKNERVSPNDELYDQFFCFEKMDLRDLCAFVFADEGDSNGFIWQLSDPKAKIQGDLNLNAHFSRNGLTLLMRDIAIRPHLLSNQNVVKAFSNDDLKFGQETVRRRIYEALDYDLGLGSRMEPWEDPPFDILPKGISRFGKPAFFLGENVASYSIGPSMFLKQRSPNGFEGAIYDLDSLFALYQEGGYSRSLLNRYNDAFHENITSSPQIDYKFLSWMQNSASFSPLIDFTKDYRIAMIEALSARNPAAFMYEDSAVYLLTTSEKIIIRNEKEADKFIREKMGSIFNLEDRIVPGSIRKVKGASNNTHVLNFSSYREIIDLLLPLVIVFDVPANDNMRKRRGSYVFFYDYVAVKGKTFPVFKNEATLERIIIGHKEKIKMREWMQKNCPMIRKAYLDDPRMEFGL